MTSHSRRLCVVTGASDGIGRETARGMAELGFDVFIIGRDPKKTERARGYVAAHATTGGCVRALRCDFSSLRQVRDLAQELLATVDRIDVLINNAGLWHPQRRVGLDGIEDTLTVNHLAPYLLTRLLLARLCESQPARVLHVTSRLHETQLTYDFEDMQFERSYPATGLHAYSQTKLANVMFSNELARRLAGTGVTSNALHPGDVMSGITRERRWIAASRWVIGPFFDSARQAARTSIHVATAAELAAVSGAYFKKCRPACPSPAAQDPVACLRLWNASAKMVQLAAAEG